MEFDFEGKSAHAAAMPWDGRSALDAAELMNVGVQFLREHVTQDVRIHYVYRNGGLAPNIVPDKASLYYFIRSREENMKDVVKRVQACAKGAAEMTGTTVEWHVEGGCHSYHGNRVLAHKGYEMPYIPVFRFWSSRWSSSSQLVNSCLCRHRYRP